MAQGADVRQVRWMILIDISRRYIKAIAIIYFVFWGSSLVAEYGETDEIGIEDKIPKGWAAIDKISPDKITIRDINGAKFSDKWDVLKSYPIPNNWVITNYSIAPISKEDGYTITYIGGAPVGCKVSCINISTLPQGWELYSTHFKHSTAIEIIKKR